MFEKLKSKTKSAIFDVACLVDKEKYIYMDYEEEFYNNYLVYGKDSYEFLKDFSYHMIKDEDTIKNRRLTNSEILVFILDDYVKLRIGKGSKTVVMKTLVKDPKNRVSMLRSEISQFTDRWDNIMKNLEAYYQLFDSLEYIDKRIVTIISSFSNFRFYDERVKKLNETYGKKYCYED